MPQGHKSTLQMVQMFIGSGSGSHKLHTPGIQVRERVLELIVITGNVDKLYVNKIFLWCDPSLAFL